MGFLKELGSGQGYLKAGFQGFQSSGKTHTAVDLAVGTRKFFGLEGPIAMLDTEGGSEYIGEKVRKETGKPFMGVKSHSFDDLMGMAKECLSAKVSVLIVDSITHIWRELQEAHLERANDLLKRRGRNPKHNLEFQDWGPIKRKWATWTDFYLNSPLHIIICARAGYEYANEENEQSGKKELVKVGTKMKAESEFGFEPSLVIEMERVAALDKSRLYDREATIIKDRFDVMDGQSIRNPTFKFFLPHLQRLKPGALTPIDSSVKSKTELDELGRDDHDRRKLDREILLEKIEAEMVKRWPGQTIEHKKLKIACLEKIFATNAWAQVKVMPLDELRAGLSMLCNLDDKLEVITSEPVEVPFAAT